MTDRDRFEAWRKTMSNGYNEWDAWQEASKQQREQTVTHELPELPPIDPQMQIGYEAIRYVAGFTESYLKDYARSYAEEAVRLEREACALECDRMVSATAVSYETGSACAAAIRARSEL